MMQLKWIAGLLVVGLLGGCSNHSGLYNVYMASNFMSLQWVVYDENLTGKKSGYELVRRTLAIDKTLVDVFDLYGKPDYVRVGSRNTLNMALLTRCSVLSYRLSETGRIAPHEIPYLRFDNLSQRLVKAFKLSGCPA